MGRMFAMNVPAPVSVWSAVLIGLPGIILQLILVPGLVFVLYKSQNRQGR
jgi:niacin transporter